MYLCVNCPGFAHDQRVNLARLKRSLRLSLNMQERFMDLPLGQVVNLSSRIRQMARQLFSRFKTRILVLEIS